jgi:hypothetical protein
VRATVGGQLAAIDRAEIHAGSVFGEVDAGCGRPLRQ